MATCNWSKQNSPPSELLDGIGFRWAVPRGKNWWKHLEQLRRFKEENGHCNVPKIYRGDRVLSNWVEAQRKRMMPANQVMALEKLGLHWKATSGRRASTQRLIHDG